jgi:acyl-ACP thioesterase
VSKPQQNIALVSKEKSTDSIAWNEFLQDDAAAQRMKLRAADLKFLERMNNPIPTFLVNAVG